MLGIICKTENKGPGTHQLACSSDRHGVYLALGIPGIIALIPIAFIIQFYFIDLNP